MGGLYRSANAMPDGAEPPPDGVPMVSAYPLDEPMVETTSPAPEVDGAGSAAANSTVMAIGSLVSRGTGFLRTLAVTAALGTAIGDAYTTAQIFPGMVYEFLLGGILTSVLVPVLVRRRKLDADRGEAYAQRLLSLGVIALGVATILALIAAPGLTLVYASGSPEAYRNLVTSLALLTLPMIFFTGLSALLAALLNTRGHFAAPMWTPILNNLVVIGTAGLYIAIFGVKLIKPEDMTPGRIVLIGGGTLLGVVVQAAGLLPALRKVGFRWRWRWDFRSLGLRELGRLGGWMFCYVAVSQLGLIVLFNLLNRAATGAKAAGPIIYNNVFLLLMMAHGIVAVSVITALMPRMSAASADGRLGDLTADLARGTRMVTVVLAPIAVGYAVLAQPVSVALFRYGAFTGKDALLTAPVLLVAGLALIPFAISQLFTFAYYALPDTKTPALVNIPVVVLRVLVQIGLFVVFAAEFAAAGVMLGNAVSYVAAAVVSAWLLRRRVGQLGMSGVATTFGKVALAALGAAVAGIVVLKVLPGGTPPSHVQAIVQIVVGGSVIVGGYVGLAFLLRLREINDIVGMVRRKLGR